LIKLYDFELSGSCYKIRLLLNILGQRYESVNVDFVKKEHKAEKYMALNPFGEIPIFEDGDLRLRDAQAIMVYLARKYDKTNRWYPDDPVSMGKIQQWLSTGGGEVMNAAGARLVKILDYPWTCRSWTPGRTACSRSWTITSRTRSSSNSGVQPSGTSPASLTRPWREKAASTLRRTRTCWRGSNA